ncbi:hypothetical protein BS78_07G033900 [Paspalum vaginatum]|nr:hypothetical protein BS78_07G033900 [Paspalum vaginatum]
MLAFLIDGRAMARWTTTADAGSSRRSRFRLFFSVFPELQRTSFCAKDRKTLNWSGGFRSCKIARRLQCSKGRGFIRSSNPNIYFDFFSSVFYSYAFPLIFLQSKRPLNRT